MNSRKIRFCLMIGLLVGIFGGIQEVSISPAKVEGYHVVAYRDLAVVTAGDTFSIYAEVYYGLNRMINPNISIELIASTSEYYVDEFMDYNSSGIYTKLLTAPLDDLSISISANAFIQIDSEAVFLDYIRFEIFLSGDIESYLPPVHLIDRPFASWSEEITMYTYVPDLALGRINETEISFDPFINVGNATTSTSASGDVSTPIMVSPGLYKTIWSLPNEMPSHIQGGSSLGMFSVSVTIKGQRFSSGGFIVSIDPYYAISTFSYMGQPGDFESMTYLFDSEGNPVCFQDLTQTLVQYMTEGPYDSVPTEISSQLLPGATGCGYFTSSFSLNPDYPQTRIIMNGTFEESPFYSVSFVDNDPDLPPMFYVVEAEDFIENLYLNTNQQVKFSFRAYQNSVPLEDQELFLLTRHSNQSYEIESVTTDTAGYFSVIVDPQTYWKMDEIALTFVYSNGTHWFDYSPYISRYSQFLRGQLYPAPHREGDLNVTLSSYSPSMASLELEYLSPFPDQLISFEAIPFYQFDPYSYPYTMRTDFAFQSFKRNPLSWMPSTNITPQPYFVPNYDNFLYLQIIAQMNDPVLGIREIHWLLDRTGTSLGCFTTDSEDIPTSEPFPTTSSSSSIPPSLTSTFSSTLPALTPAFDFLLIVSVLIGGYLFRKRDKSSKG